MIAGNRTCSCCGGTAAPAFSISDVNLRVDDRLFHYFQCASCGSYELANVPSDLGRYYPASYYAGIDEHMERQAAGLAQGQLDIFASRVPGPRLIEIGPGAGGLLRQAARAGFTDRTAIERDAGCCARLTADGVRAVQTDDAVEALARVDAADGVLMFHVIEHVDNPMELFDAAAAKVKSGGVLVVATPNPASLSFRVTKEYWLHVDAPRHLFLLPLELLTARALRNGLALEQVVTRDRMGLACDAAAWGTWAHKTVGPRWAPALISAARRLIRRAERRGLRGSTYTAIFRRL